jgi:hypothetical protein
LVCAIDQTPHVLSIYAAGGCLQRLDDGWTVTLNQEILHRFFNVKGVEKRGLIVYNDSVLPIEK